MGNQINFTNEELEALVNGVELELECTKDLYADCVEGEEEQRSMELKISMLEKLLKKLSQIKE